MKFTLILIGLLIPSIALCADDIDALRPIVKTYCVRCHGPKNQKGDLRLDRLAELDAGVFETIYERIASGEMPPDNALQPTKAERQSILKSALELAKNGASEMSTGFRRLNKREYGTTVRDLLGLHQGTFDPGEYIYDDELDDGFDTRAEALVLSNELLLEYMGAAEKSLRHALFSGETERPESRVVDVRLNRMQGTSARYVNHHRDYLIGRSGGKAKLYDGLETRTMTTPGRYTLTVTASVVDRDAYPVRFKPVEGPLVMGIGVLQDSAASVSSDGVLLKTFELKDGVEQTIRFDTWIDQGHFPYISFVNGSRKPITQLRANVRRKKIDPSELNEPYRGPGIKISQFRIEGPFHDQWPPESFRTTYDSNHIPDLENEADRKQLLLRFARRAFRRSVADEDVAPYLAYFENQYLVNQDWHDATIKTLSAMMASVDFLYIREGQGELDSFALANRLSYFLWSTMPDAELFELAKTGKLKDPAVLRGQVDRLLIDERSNRFCDSFADQWLSLDTLGTMPPDGRGKYRVYHDRNLEPAMLEETRRFFKHVLHENRSVRDFIDSDYSFINKGLADLYDVPFEGSGDEFIRVNFPRGAPRGGLLGHASILTLTANGVDTSPIERGVWVLADLLGTPPPPPPQEVPALTPDLNGAETIRDMLVKHRSDTACMECHRRIDPLGFALEAYDPIGRLRKKYSAKHLYGLLSQESARSLARLFSGFLTSLFRGPASER